MGLGGAYALAQFPQLFYANRGMFKDIPIGFPNIYGTGQAV